MDRETRNEFQDRLVIEKMNQRDEIEELKAAIDEKDKEIERLKAVINSLEFKIMDMSQYNKSMDYREGGWITKKT